MMRGQAQVSRFAKCLGRALVGDVAQCTLCAIGLCVDEVHDRALVLTEDGAVWISDEVANRCGVPVVPAREAVSIVQTLLHYGPLTFRRHYKTVQVDLKPIGNGVVVDACCEPARAHQSVTVEAAFLSKR